MFRYQACATRFAHLISNYKEIFYEHKKRMLDFRYQASIVARRRLIHSSLHENVLAFKSRSIDTEGNRVTEKNVDADR